MACQKVLCLAGLTTKKQEQFDAYSRYKGKYSDFVGNYTLYFSKIANYITTLEPLMILT